MQEQIVPERIEEQIGDMLDPPIVEMQSQMHIIPQERLQQRAVDQEHRCKRDDTEFQLVQEVNVLDRIQEQAETSFFECGGCFSLPWTNLSNSCALEDSFKDRKSQTLNLMSLHNQWCKIKRSRRIKRSRCITKQIKGKITREIDSRQINFVRK